MSTSSPAHNDDLRDVVKARRPSGASRRLSPLYLAPLPTFDVRLKRELAHRRLMVSVARRILRHVTLHATDAGVVAASVFASARLLNATVPTLAVFALVAYVLVGLNVRGAYGAGPARRDSLRLLTGVLIGAGLAVVASSVGRDAAASSSFLAVFGMCAFVGLFVERKLIDATVREAYARGIGLRRAIVICRSQEAVDLTDGLNAPPSDKRDAAPRDQLVVGYATPDESRDPNSLGSVSRLGELLDAHDISELVVAAGLRQQTLEDVAALCFQRGIRVFLILPAAQTTNLWSEATNLGRWPAYHLHPARLEVPALILKRTSDLVLATIGLIVASPLMMLIGIGIKVETHGPILFRQRRVGLGGREFIMWKFRSMKHEAEASQAEVAHLNSYADGRLFKLADDPRITRVGAFLRRFSLDELPQLVNVFAGEMSLVGPRPPLPAEVRTYEARHLVRLSVVPGLTGPWQVNGRNLITDFEEVVRLERQYIETWSLRSDIEIMLRTLGVVLSGKGAY